jgi:hypothetical protein
MCACKGGICWASAAKFASLQQKKSGSVKEPMAVVYMNNDPELNGKYLGTITADFAKVADTLKEASYQIRKQGFSDHPIFPISKTHIPIGQLMLDRLSLNLQWNYYASYLDEFVQRKLVDGEKTDAFKAVYKNPDEFCCLFVVDQEFTNFLYVPYPED